MSCAVSHVSCEHGFLLIRWFLMACVFGTVFEYVTGMRIIGYILLGVPKTE